MGDYSRNGRRDERYYDRSYAADDEDYSDDDRRERHRRRDRPRDRQTTYYEDDRRNEPSRRQVVGQQQRKDQEMVLYRRPEDSALYRAPTPPPYDEASHRLSPPPRHRGSRSAHHEPCGNESRTFYSERPRSTAPFLERHFDSSYDGIIAALAGAALGGMTADSFATPGKGGGDKYRSAKIAGGAILGAVAFNAGENAWREWVGEETQKVEQARRETRR